MFSVRHWYAIAAMVAASAPLNAQLKAPATAPATANAPGPMAGDARAPEPFTPDFRECMRTAGLEMQAKKANDAAAVLACLDDEQKRQDDRLSTASQKLAKVLPADKRLALEIANGDWRRFRISECKLIADDSGPGPFKLENADCKLRMTMRRSTDMDNSANMLIRREAAQKGQTEQAAAAPAQNK
jgi:uncharacterized protein YecT (DUF1311 family)